jgi:hypothetical protein
MSENESDIQSLVLERDPRNKPVLVSTNIEYETRANQVCVRVGHPNLGEVIPNRSLRYPIPVIKRLGCGLVICREFLYRSMAYDSQRPMFTRCEPNVKHYERLWHEADSEVFAIPVDISLLLQFA